MADLTHRLAELQQQCPNIGNVCVALADEENRCCAATEQGATLLDVSETYANCIAKLFTSALMSQLVKQSRVQLHQEVLDYFPASNTEVRRALCGIRLEHLLNHTHGLDDSSLRRLPALADGTIDVKSLCSSLASTPSIVRPGHLYNYGSVGAYLCGAVIESVYECSFHKALVREILDPLRLTMRQSNQPISVETVAICPATGGRWLLSADDVITLLISHLQLNGRRENLTLKGHQEMMLSHSQPLPGWNPAEHTINLGWKGYGADWYGHDARTKGSSLLARINTRSRIAISIGSADFSGGDPCRLVLARLFGDIFPEIAAIDVPMLLDPDSAPSMDYAAQVGVYRTCQSEINVFVEQQSLFARLASRDHETSGEDNSARTYRLMPTSQNVFLTFPSEQQRLPYIQFICPSAGGCCEYIWNGQNLWHRIGPSNTSRALSMLVSPNNGRGCDQEIPSNAAGFGVESPMPVLENAQQTTS